MHSKKDVLRLRPRQARRNSCVTVEILVTGDVVVEEVSISVNLAWHTCEQKTDSDPFSLCE